MAGTHGEGEFGADRQTQGRIEHLETVLRAVRRSQHGDPAVPDVEAEHRLVHHHDPMSFHLLALARVERHALAEGQESDVPGIGSSDEDGLAEAAVAIADDGDPLVLRFVAVADRAIPHEPAPDRVGQVR